VVVVVVVVAVDAAVGVDVVVVVDEGAAVVVDGGSGGVVVVDVGETAPVAAASTAVFAWRGTDAGEDAAEVAAARTTRTTTDPQELHRPRGTTLTLLTGQPIWTALTSSSATEATR
jgi:hypothetical protein